MAFKVGYFNEVFIMRIVSLPTITQNEIVNSEVINRYSELCGKNKIPCSLLFSTYRIIKCTAYIIICITFFVLRCMRYVSGIGVPLILHAVCEAEYMTVDVFCFLCRIFCAAYGWVHWWFVTRRTRCWCNLASDTGIRNIVNVVD